MAKGYVKRLVKFLKWAIWGGVLFFLVQAIRANWQDIAAIKITSAGWGCVMAATGITLFAHIWSGWVWGWILAALNYPQAQGSWAILTYLKTNIAKYLPGNVWHFVGRVMSAKAIAIPIEASTVSVVMEALLMAVAALLVGLLSSQHLNRPLQMTCLIIGLVGIHPRILNPIIKRLKQSKLKAIAPSTHPPTPPLTPPPTLPPSTTHLTHYPIAPLLGELGFLALRSLGFVTVAIAITPLSWAQLPALISGFSLAWMLGLVIPGAPGGIGVFEATAIALLGPSTHLSNGIILGTVALYRLVSTLAEAMGAVTAWLDEKRSGD
ncbi:MAG: UPF0104 family protein [Leptolyngbyaceae bacterium]|nr:UPF0104 family protein [Leptolyngbyaceae bacterium]